MLEIYYAVLGGIITLCLLFWNRLIERKQIKLSAVVLAFTTILVLLFI